jgi:hypothetical protein
VVNKFWSTIISQPRVSIVIHENVMLVSKTGLLDDYILSWITKSPTPLRSPWTISFRCRYSSPRAAPIIWVKTELINIIFHVNVGITDARLPVLRADCFEDSDARHRVRIGVISGQVTGQCRDISLGRALHSHVKRSAILVHRDLNPGPHRFVTNYLPFPWQAYLYGPVKDYRVRVKSSKYFNRNLCDPRDYRNQYVTA